MVEKYPYQVCTSTYKINYKYTFYTEIWAPLAAATSNCSLARMVAFVIQQSIVSSYDDLPPKYSTLNYTKVREVHSHVS